MSNRKKRKDAAKRAAAQKQMTANAPVFSYSNYTLKIIALVMIAIGTIGESLIQFGALDMKSFSPDELMHVMESNSNAFWLVAILLTCKGIMSLALPIYAFLLVEGYQHTSSALVYGLRISVVALLAEIPYNLAMQGEWFTRNSQNPVWGVLIGFIILCFFQYSDKLSKTAAILIKIVVVIAGILWSGMLNISYGTGFVILVVIFWCFKERKVLSMVLSSVASILYFPAPLGSIMIYFYNKKKGKDSRRIFYILYPVVLLVFGLIGKYWM